MATLLAGRKLITKWGAAPANALQGKVVLLYFSASWCGPCHQFTPILKDFYDEVQAEAGGNLEIVYVPGDRSLQEMMQYFQGEHANYLALDMADAQFIQHLNQVS
jgi:nucleoredoxin